jgi:hypothetical protein
MDRPEAPGDLYAANERWRLRALALAKRFVAAINDDIDRDDDTDDVAMDVAVCALVSVAAHVIDQIDEPLREEARRYFVEHVQNPDWRTPPGAPATVQ